MSLTKAFIPLTIATQMLIPANATQAQESTLKSSFTCIAMDNKLAVPAVAMMDKFSAVTGVKFTISRKPRLSSTTNETIEAYTLANIHKFTDERSKYEHEVSFTINIPSLPMTKEVLTALEEVNVSALKISHKMANNRKAYDCAHSFVEASLLNFGVAQGVYIKVNSLQNIQPYKQETLQPII